MFDSCEVSIESIARLLECCSYVRGAKAARSAQGLSAGLEGKEPPFGDAERPVTAGIAFPIIFFLVRGDQ
jgi:hypothetical protein